MSLPKINGEVARLTQDPELRYTSGGKAVVTVNLAFNKRRKNEQTGNWEDVGKLFLRGTAWEQFAENIAESLSKSDEVIVSGELSLREYERQDGTKGQSMELALYAIGPNLKAFSVKVNRAARSGAGSPAPADDPWGSAPPASTGGFTDEPPF